MLYSVVIKFRAKEDIYFKYFPSESLHGAFFKVINKQNKKKADILHNDYQIKPFTISPILPYPSWSQGRRKLIAEKEYFFRITFLQDKWYQLFMESFLYHGAKLNLQNSEVEIIEVLSQSKQDKRVNIISYQDLIKKEEFNKKLNFKFHSTTSFRLADRHVILPIAKYVFYSLVKKWEEFSEYDLSLETSDFEQIYISKYKISSAMEKFSDYPIKGFEGNCQFELDSSLTKDKIKELNLLAKFSFYSGVGYKTTMGLGQVAVSNFY